MYEYWCLWKSHQTLSVSSPTIYIYFISSFIVSFFVFQNLCLQMFTRLWFSIFTHDLLYFLKLNCWFISNLKKPKNQYLNEHVERSTTPGRQTRRPQTKAGQEPRKEKAEFSLAHWAKTSSKSERPTWLPSPLHRPLPPRPPPSRRRRRRLRPRLSRRHGSTNSASLRLPPATSAGWEYARAGDPLSPGFEFLPRSCCFCLACFMFDIQLWACAAWSGHISFELWCSVTTTDALRFSEYNAVFIF